MKALVAIVAVILAMLGYRAYSTSHIGAPALPYTCHAGQHVVRWWVPDSSPVGRGAPGTLEYHGSREIASCAASTTITGG